MGRAHEAPYPPGAIDVLLAASIARRFYLEHRSKTEIADEFDVSRFKVARMLDAAVELGIVRIDITVPAKIDTEYSLALRERFGLKYATVIDVGVDGQAVDGGEQMPRWLGAVAAQLISEIVDCGDVLGLSWGRSTDALCQAITKLAPCEVVQLTGTHPNEWAGDESIAPVCRAGTVGGGTAYPIQAPLVVPNALTGSIVIKQPGIAAAVARFDRITKAVVEIGAWSPTLSTVYDALTEPERRGYRQRGVVGEVCGHLFDADGRAITAGMDDRVISIEMAKLAKIPEVIAVAGGTGKADAISAVLASGLLSGIITDVSAARRMLSVDAIRGAAC
ncbi:DNA-binding transcriptional regulator LsrR (DeoR family) [Streptomyces sp. V4I23]|uniref:sugar-binding transcriptional regulator n=1 Tax=Streptomyces sp. V4I23 TaxID=3042282 RepID=UPI0027846DF4|nr:sugar-binding domain-containing protein [Streptomyces sp. V4I23]MDQ1005942.1 DNA-binding transcriptional regulator LsrR (DeoR family) [Streptomyces sp. V4I23]